MTTDMTVLYCCVSADVSKAPCGQTLSKPKVIPRLPFYYEDDTTLYADSYGPKYDSCHDSGKDVVFQYKPAHDMVRGGGTLHHIRLQSCQL